MVLLAAMVAVLLALLAASTTAASPTALTLLDKVDNIVPSFFLIASSRIERKLTYSLINTALAPPAIVTNEALLDSGLTSPSGLAVNTSSMWLYVADPGAHAVLALRLRVGSKPATDSLGAAHGPTDSPSDSLGAAASSKPSSSQLVASLVPFLAPSDEVAVPTLSVVGAATTLMTGLDASFLAVDDHDGSLVVTTATKGVLRLSADALADLETADPARPPQVHIVESAALASARKTAAAVGEGGGDSKTAVLAALGLPQSAVIAVRLLDVPATGVAVSERRLLLGSSGGAESLVLATDLGATATPTQLALSHHAASGVAVSAGGGGALFVASATTGSLFRADLLRPRSPPIVISDTFKNPQQVAVDGQGTVFVADSAASVVWGYSADARERTEGELIVSLNGVFGLAVLPLTGRSEGGGGSAGGGSAGSASCAVAALAMVMRW